MQPREKRSNQGFRPERFNSLEFVKTTNKKQGRRAMDEAAGNSAEKVKRRKKSAPNGKSGTGRKVTKKKGKAANDAQVPKEQKKRKVKKTPKPADDESDEAETPNDSERESDATKDVTDLETGAEGSEENAEGHPDKKKKKTKKRKILATDDDEDNSEEDVLSKRKKKGAAKEKSLTPKLNDQLQNLLDGNDENRESEDDTIILDPENPTDDFPFPNYESTNEENPNSGEIPKTKRKEKNKTSSEESDQELAGKENKSKKVDFEQLMKKCSNKKQLYGSKYNKNGVQMMEMYDGVFCKMETLNSVLGRSTAKATYAARRLIPGIFKKSAVLNGTISGQPCRAQSKEAPADDDAQESKKVIKLDSKAIGAIVEFTQQCTAQYDWKKYEDKEILSSMRQKINELKRSASIAKKQNKKFIYA